ncbi:MULTISPECIES: ImmA/IrrE family metallo-endopeptidase [unclassified Lysinibacillus]|uniref:ImmA/IrrE family metallo-endopeptidase n=1 Tax=unclassified Lysinibacillus TaxID=2636778 RepID=UPI003802192F
MSIKSIVNQLIKKYGTNDPFKLAEYMGVLIVFEPLGNALGYYNKHFRVPMIHINENADRKLQIFICAHELGHYVQHEDINTSFLKKHTLFSTDKIEIEANTFAVELLLPDELFLEQDNYSCFTIYDAIKEKGVPIELLSLKNIGGKKILP